MARLTTYLDIESRKILRSGFDFKSNLYISDWLFSKSRLLASYVSRHRAMAYDIALAIGHCCLCHRRPSQLSSPLAITVNVAVGHFRELLPWHSKNCIRPIDKAKNAHLNLFCFDSGRRTDQSRMTDQVSSGNGQHQDWAASGKQ